ncbi:MAG: hypothetical protein G01um101472_628 [Parcubacteria group bacterium Gr01-1014_72]|nr:MAG: hypothetical protein G01um101472_628 [Parcubacteria group bacterium Gr01-1014_72]
MDYDAVIPKLCPGYERALAEFSMRAQNAGSILDLGIGTGNVARVILSKNPRAVYFGIDADESMLSRARVKLGAGLQITCDDFRTFVIPSVDLVVSSLSIHHLEHDEQKQLFGQIYERSPRFLHFELVAPETKAAAKEWKEAIDAHVTKQAEVLGLDAALLLKLQDMSAQKDKPMAYSAHEKTFKSLGAKVECVFRENCFAFYDVSRA